jgi:hypothetical protein
MTFNIVKIYIEYDWGLCSSVVECKALGSIPQHQRTKTKTTMA